MATANSDSEAEGGIQKWEKEEEEEVAAAAAAAAAAAGASMEEEAPDSPRDLLSPRRKAQDEGPVEVKLELHRLQSRWALWFFKNDRSRAWQDNLHLVTKFDTVEDFWAVYNHTQLPSKLSPGCDYSLFKDGIEPMWEDPRNKRGGRWLVSLSKQQRHMELDHLWLETVSRGGWEGRVPKEKGRAGMGLWWQWSQGWQMQSLYHSWRSHHSLFWPQLLCVIGESFGEYSREVCGAVINIRTKGDKIAVWTQEAENRTGVIHIGHVYKECLGLPPKMIIGYQAHADTATKSSTLLKNNTLLKNKFVM
ncbi:eukaryotic translation initiation factor 4E type 1B isoform 3-T5 [Hipposideros larvatus]